MFWKIGVSFVAVWLLEKNNALPDDIKWFGYTGILVGLILAAIFSG